MIRQAVILYLVSANLVAFGLYAWDKRQAQLKRWRVPESRLLWIAALGGAMGALLAMQLCRHKTQKWPFALGVPLILVLETIVFLLAWFEWLPNLGP